MGYCQYRYSATEQYQRTKPGMAPETSCGAPTHAAVDDPELVPVVEQGPDGPVHILRPSGRFTARPQDDPHCPAHGGTEPPPEPVITLDQIEAHRDAYNELVARFSAQQLPAGPRPPTFDEVVAAGQQLTATIAAASSQNLRAIEAVRNPA